MLNAFRTATRAQINDKADNIEVKIVAEDISESSFFLWVNGFKSIHDYFVVTLTYHFRQVLAAFHVETA